MRFRLLVVGGAVAALSTFTLTANATPGVGGACTTNLGRPTPSGTVQALPDGGTAYAGGSQTSGAVGVQGAYGMATTPATEPHRKGPRSPVTRPSRASTAA